MEELRRIHGGLVEMICDRRFVRRRTREVKGSQVVLRQRRVQLESRLDRSSCWLERLRFLAVASLGLGLLGLWPLTVALLLLVWALVALILFWQEGCRARLDRLQRRLDICHLELFHLQRDELYVPLR